MFIDARHACTWSIICTRTVNEHAVQSSTHLTGCEFPTNHISQHIACLTNGRNEEPRTLLKIEKKTNHSSQHIASLTNERNEEPRTFLKIKKSMNNLPASLSRMKEITLVNFSAFWKISASFLRFRRWSERSRDGRGKRGLQDFDGYLL